MIRKFFQLIEEISQIAVLLPLIRDQLGSIQSKVDFIAREQVRALEENRDAARK